MKHATILIASLALGLAAGTVCAKLPAPSDEAKAKADEARAKTAHGDKLAAFQLCRAMDKLAGDHSAAARRAGKPASAPTATPACADPGAFVYVPQVAASAPAAPAASAAVVSAAPAKK